jgi:hypothetical protein
MVRPQGFEPWAYGFVVNHGKQLFSFNINCLPV